MSQEIQVESIQLSHNQPGSIEILGIPIYYFSFVAIFLFLFAYCRMAKDKTKYGTEIAIMGQRFAGKTQLFISMNQGKKFETAPSIKNNSAQFSLNGKKYKLTDFHGDAISKEQVLSRLHEFYGIIHIIDGTDPTTFSDAAMLIYRVLTNKSYQQRNCEYIILLNKNDDKKYIGLNKAKQRLEDEIQHIKNSRINSGEEDKEDQEDFIKLTKGRFKIPFQMVEGSAVSNIKDLEMTLSNL